MLDGIRLLFGNPPAKGGSEGGSNSFEWWTRTQRIRTAGQVRFEATLLDTAQQPTYQRIAQKALQLEQLGLHHSAIASRLGVTDKTVAKGIRWLELIRLPTLPRDQSP